MKIKGFGNATKKMIQDFENQIDFRLPDDYKEFLIKYNGGIPYNGYAIFRIEELKEDVPLDVLLGLGVDNLDLSKRNQEYREDMLPRSIVIGDDPGCGMIVLIAEKEDQGIYYWDHAFTFEQSNEDSNVYKISDSFTEFLETLHEQK